MSQSPPSESKRRRWLAPTIFILIGASLMLVAAYFFLGTLPRGGEPEAAPLITANQTQIDLGELKINQPARAAFTIGNAGEGRLVFSQEPVIEVVTGC